jgi:thioredoxin-related protein
MEGIVDVWSEDDEYINRVLFIKCNKETSNHDIFEKYNIKAMPTTLFIKNNEQIAPPATGSVDIEEVINGILNSKK